jgi:hypothetical protein
MNDRELLERAAKAAGYEFRYADQLLGCEVWNDAMEQSEFWNPLDDDGDALRLAVVLGIEIDPRLGCVYAGPGGTTERTRESFDVTDEGGFAATRRAIVRAAAEIGKALT